MTAADRYKPTVRVPDGRVFRGIWPQSLAESNSETPYIRALASQVKGVAEVTLPAGRADVANETTAFEVEAVGTWRAGARQAFSYSAMSGLAPAVALFGEADYLKIYTTVRDDMPPLQLWIWVGGKFVHCQSSRVAASYSQRRPPRKKPKQGGLPVRASSPTSPTPVVEDNLEQVETGKPTGCPHGRAFHATSAEYTACVVSTWPPLTGKQRALIAAVLLPVTDLADCVTTAT